MSRPELLILLRKGKFSFLFHKLKQQCNPWDPSIFLIDELKKMFQLYWSPLRPQYEGVDQGHVVGEQHSEEWTDPDSVCLGSKRTEAEVFICLLYACPHYKIWNYTCPYYKIWNKGGAKVCYSVFWELRQLLSRALCLAYSGQPLLSWCNSQQGSEPSHGADYKSIDFRRLWSCFLELK